MSFREAWAVAAWAVAVASLGFTAGARADWPEFRGPTGQGIAAEKLPTEWGPEKNIAWKQPIPGRGWSSPVIAKGKIILTTSLAEGEGDSKAVSLRVLAIEASSGKIAWEREVFRPEGKAVVGIHGKNSHASPTPILEGERIFVHFGHHGAAALDGSGAILWKNNEFAYGPVHGNGGTPAIAGSVLTFSADGGSEQNVFGLHCDTGRIAWKTPRNTKVPKKFAFSTPLVIEAAGARQIISPGAGFVGAYDPENGKEIWRVHYGDGYSVIPRPVFGHGLAYVSSSFDQPKLIAIRPDGQGDVTSTHIAWTLDKGAPHTPSPLLVGDELYCVSDNGVATCVDAKTGAVHWQKRIGGNHSASPLAADGKIYFLSEEGTGIVVSASKTFELLAENAMNERSLASYAASDGALYLRTESNLYKIAESPPTQK